MGDGIHDLRLVDPPLDGLLAELRSYGASGEEELERLPGRYGKAHEPPYWRFFFEGPLEAVAKAPPDARRLVISAKARDFRDISKLSELEAVSVADFGPGAAAVLAKLPKLSCLALWSGPLTDLTSLAPLRGLRRLLVNEGTRLLSLSGLEELAELRTLKLAGIPKVKRLDPIASLTELEGLELHAGVTSGTIPDRTKFNSLAPLRGLDKLKVLRLWEIRAADDDLRPVAELRGLEELEIPPRTFPLEAMAQAAARRPGLLKGWLRPVRTLVPCAKCGTAKAVLIGRGTRDICSKCRSQEIQAFFDRFRKLVAQ